MCSDPNEIKMRNLIQKTRCLDVLDEDIYLPSIGSIGPGVKEWLASGTTGKEEEMRGRRKRRNIGKAIYLTPYGGDATTVDQ